MSRFLMVASLLLVAGCNQRADTDSPQANHAEAPSAEAAKPAIPELSGNWRVTKSDGRPIDPAMAAVFERGRVRITAGCMRRAWTFTQQRNIVSFSADPGASANCEIPPSSKQDAAFYAIDHATMAIFDKDGRRANLSGNGGNVTLERG